MSSKDHNKIPESLGFMGNRYETIAAIRIDFYHNLIAPRAINLHVPI